MSTDLVTRMKEVAEQIGTLPSTGTIEAERVMEILGESVALILETVQESTDHVAFAKRLLNSCDHFYAENQRLREANNGLVWQLVGAQGVEGNA